MHGQVDRVVAGWVLAAEPVVDASVANGSTRARAKETNPATVEKSPALVGH